MARLWLERVSSQLAVVQMGIVIGSRNQSCCIPMGLECCVALRCGRCGLARIPPNCRIMG
jgi:hypothetical protein